MLIISKHKDYYDGVVGTTGIDKTIVYERKEVELKDYKEFPKVFQRKNTSIYRDDNPFLSLNGYSIDSKKYDRYVAFIVGFCGKLYIGWKLYYVKKAIHFYQSDKTIIDITYDLNIVRKHIKIKAYKSNIMDDINYILNYNPIDVFRTINSPVFIYDPNIDCDMYNKSTRFYINPILKNYKFYRLFDTFTTFQEIQMFISGVLGTGEKEIKEVADKYKIPQHGFDKWSFRKEPTKNK